MRRWLALGALVLWVPVSGFVGSQAWHTWTRMFWGFSPVANLVFVLGTVWAALWAFRLGETVRAGGSATRACVAAAAGACIANLLVYTATVMIAFGLGGGGFLHALAIAWIVGRWGLLLAGAMLAAAVLVADRQGWLPGDPIEELLAQMA